MVVVARVHAARPTARAKVSPIRQAPLRTESSAILTPKRDPEITRELSAKLYHPLEALAREIKNFSRKIEAKRDPLPAYSPASQSLKKIRTKSDNLAFGIEQAAQLIGLKIGIVRPRMMESFEDILKKGYHYFEAIWESYANKNDEKFVEELIKAANEEMARIDEETDSIISNYIYKSSPFWKHLTEHLWNAEFSDALEIVKEAKEDVLSEEQRKYLKGEIDKISRNFHTSNMEVFQTNIEGYSKRPLDYYLQLNLGKDNAKEFVKAMQSLLERKKDEPEKKKVIDLWNRTHGQGFVGEMDKLGISNKALGNLVIVRIGTQRVFFYPSQNPDERSVQFQSFFDMEGEGRPFLVIKPASVNVAYYDKQTHIDSIPTYLIEKGYVMLESASPKSGSDNPIDILHGKVIEALRKSNMGFKRHYFMCPNNHMFLDMNGHESQNQFSIYELDTWTNGNLAAFRIYRGLDVQYAIRNIADYLADACDYEGSQANVTQIINIEEGHAIRVETGWRITKKAKIEFVAGVVNRGGVPNQGDVTKPSVAGAEALATFPANLYVRLIKLQDALKAEKDKILDTIGRIPQVNSAYHALDNLIGEGGPFHLVDLLLAEVAKIKNRPHGSHVSPFYWVGIIEKYNKSKDLYTLIIELEGAVQGLIEDAEAEIRKVSPTLLETNPIYAEMPDGAGCFNFEYLKNGRFEMALYEIVPQSLAQGNDLAEVRICPSESAQRRAIGVYERFLSPACTYPGIPGDKDTGIVMIEPGQARLEDSKWRIVKKVKIEFGRKLDD